MTGIGGSESSTDNIVSLRRRTTPHVSDEPSVDVDEQMLELLKAEIRGALPPDPQSNGDRGIDLLPEDIQLIRSEACFRERFGFALGKRGRVAVMQFMDEYDLTSHDIRALYTLRSMTWNGETLRLRYVFWFKLIGFVQIAGLALVLLPVLFVLLRYPDAPWQARAVLVFLTAILMFGIIWAHGSFIAPFNGLKRRQRR